MDFFHEFGGSLSRNLCSNPQPKHMNPLIAQPYYGTGRPPEPEVSLRLEYGDTRWEIAICIHQTYPGMSEQNPTILTSEWGMVSSRMCKPTIQEGDFKYGAYVPIIFAVDDIIPRNLNDVVYHFYEQFVANKNVTSLPTRFHRALATLRRTLKEILVQVPSLCPPRLVPWPHAPKDDPIALYCLRGETWMSAYQSDQEVTAPHTKVKLILGAPQLDPKSYPFRMHTREQWLAYAETMSTHDIKSTSIQEYLTFCRLYRLIPRETDFIRARI